MFFSSAEINENPTRDTNAGPVVIGRQSKTTLETGRAFQGQIAEIVAYTEAHSAQQRQKMESYFSEKYKVPLIA